MSTFFCARGACTFFWPWSAFLKYHLHMYNRPVLYYCLGTQKNDTTTSMVTLACVPDKQFNLVLAALDSLFAC